MLHAKINNAYHVWMRDQRVVINVTKVTLLMIINAKIVMATPGIPNACSAQRIRPVVLLFAASAI